MAKSENKSALKAKKQSTDTELAKLQAENDVLKQEITMLITKKQKRTHQRSFWQSFFAGAAAILAIISFVLFNVSYWTNQTIIDNKKFTAAVAPIINNEAVQTTLQKEITKQIFTRINVEQELKDVLPENLQFIAAPFASQVESFTSDKISDALKSPQVADAWKNVISTVHGQLIAYIQDPSNNGVITVDDVYTKVGDQLKDSQIGFLFGKNLPSSIGSVTVTEVKWVPQAREALNNLQKLTNILAATTVISVIVAVALSTRRKSMIVGLISSAFVAMLLCLVALAVGHWQLGQSVAPEYKDAVLAVQTTVTTGLVNQIQGFAALFGALLVIIFAASSLDWVQWLRKQFRLLLDWLFTKLPVRIATPSWLVWIAHNQIVISWTLIAVMFVTFALRIPPTKNGVIGAFIGSVIAVVVLACAASFVRVQAKVTKK